ncbi:MAG: alkylresorcinol/alkylpyrone synthase [Saprospiraceae bacterium]|jgi:predicted naringenin-chalcone synthase
MVKIKAVAKALPGISRSTDEIIPFVEAWMAGQDERFQRKVLKIFRNAAVDRRYSVISPEDVFSVNSFEARNDLYVKGILPLAEQAVTNALDKAQWSADQLDYVISVSCTGFMIPSVDAYLINKMGMRQDVVRLPVTEMGCAAGVSGIIYANNFLKANPGKKAAVIAVESPTATFQLDDYSMANIVSAAIFGDGAACVLLSSDENDDGPTILNEEMYHFPDTTRLMGFDLKNSGLQMVLDQAVPETIAEHFPKIIHPFLEKTGHKIADVDHLIFHPGGKKIVLTTQELFGAMGKNIDDTKEVLRLYGNMSSATVLYVLERFMDKDIPKGEKGLMLSFGPGFSAQRVLLEW